MGRGGTEEKQKEMKHRTPAGGSGPNKQTYLYLGCLTKTQLIIVSVAVALVVVVMAITVPAVLLTKPAPPPPAVSTAVDMLDFLVQTGEISEPDGLFATWYHRANSKEEMNKALASDAMILEADITLEGYATPSEKPIPIMAHFPDIYSDNTLDQWLDSVLASRKCMKLDFKALESVGLSLDLLRQKNNSVGINRPVWLNADIIQGPNVPDFFPIINGTAFLQLIQEKFPDVTLSPGWKVNYAPPLFTGTYTRSMMEEMYNMIRDVPQKVTFPVHALLARSGWEHLSWILSQSPRFSLTLWQGSVHPNISDLLFIRDNTHPTRVYYDIYEPTLTEFKEAAAKPGRLRRFYPGGNLMDFLSKRVSSLDVHWSSVSDRSSLMTQLSDDAGGMLVVPVSSDSSRPGVPLVEGSRMTAESLTLQDVLELLGENAAAPWGVYLKVPTQQLLEASLSLLSSAYSQDLLYRPVWINMEGLQGANNNLEDFVSAVESLFPYVTLVLSEQNWPPRIPSAVAGLSQQVALRLNSASLPKETEQLQSIKGIIDRYDLILEGDTQSRAEASGLLNELMRQSQTNRNLYVMSDRS